MQVLLFLLLSLSGVGIEYNLKRRPSECLLVLDKIWPWSGLIGSAGLLLVIDALLFFGPSATDILLLAINCLSCPCESYLLS